MRFILLSIIRDDLIGKYGYYLFTPIFYPKNLTNGFIEVTEALTNFSEFVNSFLVTEFGQTYLTEFMA